MGGFRRNSKLGVRNEPFIYIREVRAVEKHVTRTLDALERSVERGGGDMDDILHLQVFLCLPLAEGIITPTGKVPSRPNTTR